MTTKQKNRTSKPKAGSMKISSPKELQAQAVAALGGKVKAATLTTEKDGHRFAIRSLRALERLEYSRQKTSERFDHWSAKAENSDPSEPGIMMIYRTGPQATVLKDAFDRIYRDGTEQARCGFFVVMTDYIGSAVCGAGLPNISRYEREFSPWGSASFRNPKAAARAIAKGQSVYRYRPMTNAEKRREAKERRDLAAKKAAQARVVKLQERIREASRELARLTLAA